MIILGITGNIGAGKTTVANFFAQRGARIVDADSIAHSLLQTEMKVRKNMVEHFGCAILNKDGLISRKKLARLAFLNLKNWQFLCKVLHPPVIKAIKSQIQKAKRDKINLLAIDAVLLIESGLIELVDYCVVVRANLKQEFARARKNLGLSAQDFRKRLKFQLPLKEKIKQADFVIDNRKTLKLTERQVDQIWEKIIKKQVPLKN